MNLQPTQGMITAATRLLAVMAAAEIAAESYNTKQALVLEKLKLKPEDNKMLELYQTRGIEEPAYIQTDWDLTLLTIHSVDSPEFATSQFGRWYSEMDKVMRDAGFLHGINAKCKAESDVAKYRYALFCACQDSGQFPPIEWDRLTANMDYYKQFFDLTLKMLAPYVNNDANKNFISLQISKDYFTFTLTA